jgi:hypothetical protein
MAWNDRRITIKSFSVLIKFNNNFTRIFSLIKSLYKQIEINADKF